MTAALPGALAPYVASVVAYDVDLGTPGVHRGLPSPTLTLVFPVVEPLDVAWAAEAGSRRRGWSSVSGLHAGPAEIRHDGHQRGVQVALRPAGARALLGVPAAALAGRLLEVGDLPDPGHHLRHLPEQLAAAPHRSGTDLVVRALLRSLAAHERADLRPEVGEALARLTAGGRVQQVADLVGYSRRHLGSLLRAETGLAPRQLRQIGRFDASRALVAGRARLADVAAACGYADQAHLTREWLALAGCTPSAWRREELPFLQDLGARPEQDRAHE